MGMHIPTLPEEGLSSRRMGEGGAANAGSGRAGDGEGWRRRSERDGVARAGVGPRGRGMANPYSPPHTLFPYSACRRSGSRTAAPNAVSSSRAGVGPRAAQQRKSRPRCGRARALESSGQFTPPAAPVPPRPPAPHPAPQLTPRRSGCRLSGTRRWRSCHR